MAQSAVLILDASLLINFLKVDRVDLIQAYPAKILITEHVRDEVTTAYPEQLARLDQAITASTVEVLIINDISEIEEIVTFRDDKTQRQLGLGECSAIILASKRNCSIGIDDGPAIKVVKRQFPEIKIIRTQDVIVEAINCGAIDVIAADRIKDQWANHHRFKLNIRSFSALLKKGATTKSAPQK